MIYLSSFKLPTKPEEDEFSLSCPPEFVMQCYRNENAYPFKLFPAKGLRELIFRQPITVLCGANGSGKSTLLNVIAEKLQLERTSSFSRSPVFNAYTEMCDYRYQTKIPESSRIVTSDDVFDYLLGIRAINDGLEHNRSELFTEYKRLRDELYEDSPFLSLDDLDRLKARNEAVSKTKSEFTRRRIPKELLTRSNGESAFSYFTERIGDNTLYLLDEPENSLSPVLQLELAKFIEESARFFGCQFIIATHSPFLLALGGASVYDLDSTPAKETQWYKLDGARIYYEFFEKHGQLFT